MRGDKIIGGVGAQSATVFAGRIGPQTFRLRNRWHLAMTVGDLGGNYGFFDPFAGKLEPDVWNGTQITQFLIEDTDVCLLDAVSIPWPNIDSLSVKVEGFSRFLLSFNGTSGRYDGPVPGFNAYLSSRVGDVVGIRLAKG